MLNTEKNAEFNELTRDIDEIRVLNYNKATQKFTREEVTALKSSLKKENYAELMMINEKENKISLYSREKRGELDVQKFMQLKSKLDTKL
jgi:hypothetical protein